MPTSNFFRKDGFKSELIFEDVMRLDDSHYLDFIRTSGDGFYFNHSLHLYGTSREYAFHDLTWRTKLVCELFLDFVEPETVCFGEDLFGNQFVFYSAGIGFLNIETGEIEFIGRDFSDWLEKVNESKDYYSGESLMLQWMKKDEIDPEERLTPKIPFVLGGNFEIDNLYRSNYEQVLRFNADLAKQIKDLPDREAVSIEIR